MAPKVVPPLVVFRRHSVMLNFRPLLNRSPYLRPIRYML